MFQNILCWLSTHMILSVLLFLAWFLFYRYLKHSKNRALINKLPGPKGLPLIGNIDLFSKDDKPIKDKLLPVHKTLCKEFNDFGFYRIRFGHQPIVYCFKANTVEPVVMSKTNIVKSESYNLLRIWLRNGLAISSGQRWREDRKSLTHAFHLNVLENFVPIFNEHATKLVDHLLQVGKVNNVLQIMKCCTIDALCDTSMGLKLNSLCQANGNSYMQNIELFMNLFVNRSQNPLIHNDFLYGLTKGGKQAKQVVKELHDFTMTIVEKRKQELAVIENANEDNHADKKCKPRSLLDLLLSLHFKDPSYFTLVNVQEQLDTFTFAGHDTIALTVTYALWHIARYPDIQSRLQCEIDTLIEDRCEQDITAGNLKHFHYLECVVRETLRLYPPAPFFGRKLSEALKINGYEIPAGTDVWVNLLGLHRDEEMFENAEKFEPDRWIGGKQRKLSPMAYLPFSGGIRSCIGHKFAINETKIILVHILRSLDVNAVSAKEDKLQVSCLGLMTPRNSIQLLFSKRS